MDKPDMMGMLRVPLGQLTGRALDWAVAHANGWQLLVVTVNEGALQTSIPVPEWAEMIKWRRGAYWLDHQSKCVEDAYWPSMNEEQWFFGPYNPTEDSHLAMTLSERYKIDLMYMDDGDWWAIEWDKEGGAEAKDIKTAICRARVNSVLGDVISVPALLVQEAAA